MLRILLMNVISYSVCTLLIVITNVICRAVLCGSSRSGKKVAEPPLPIPQGTQRGSEEKERTRRFSRSSEMAILPRDAVSQQFVPKSIVKNMYSQFTHFWIFVNSLYKVYSVSSKGSWMQQIERQICNCWKLRPLTNRWHSSCTASQWRPTESWCGTPAFQETHQWRAEAGHLEELWVERVAPSFLEEKKCVQLTIHHRYIYLFTPHCVVKLAAIAAHKTTY